MREVIIALILLLVPTLVASDPKIRGAREQPFNSLENNHRRAKDTYKKGETRNNMKNEERKRTIQGDSGPIGYHISAFQNVSIASFPKMSGDVTSLGTQFIYSDALFSNRALTETSGGYVSGSCKRTQVFVTSGDTTIVGGGTCQFTYTIVDESRMGTIQASGEVFDLISSTLSITGGTEDLVGATGEVVLRAFYDGSAAGVDFFTQASYYRMRATFEVDPQTPTVVPQIPTVAPQTTPTKAPQSTPTKAPQITPTKAPQITPTKAPQTTPTVVPQTTPTVVPQTAPTVVPQTTPTVVPQTTPTVVPQTAPTVVPQTAPTVVPQTAPTVVPQTAPTVVPQTAPTVVPQTPPTAAPQTTPPTFAPTPAAGSEPVCLLCGVATSVITLNSTVIVTPANGNATCAQLYQAGLNGQVPAASCSLLQFLKATCGCTP